MPLPRLSSDDRRPHRFVSTGRSSTEPPTDKLLFLLSFYFFPAPTKPITRIPATSYELRRPVGHTRDQSLLRPKATPTRLRPCRNGSARWTRATKPWTRSSSTPRNTALVSVGCFPRPPFRGRCSMESLTRGLCCHQAVVALARSTKGTYSNFNFSLSS